MPDTLIARSVVRLPGEGLTLFAEASGDLAGAPVIFLHGGGQSHRAWRGAAAVTAARGRLALNVDLRGHGDSDWAVDGDYGLRAFARDVAAVLGHLRTPAVLVGASRGGQAALVGAAMAPDLVAGVVLIDAAPRIDKHGVAKIQRFLIGSRPGFASLDEAARALAHFLQKPARVDNAGLARAMRRGEDGRLYWNWDSRLADLRFLDPPSDELDMIQAARMLRVPVLLARGGASDVVSPASVEHFRSLTPSLEVVDLPGVGHLMTGEQNDIFAPVIGGFIDRVVTRRSDLGG